VHAAREVHRVELQLAGDPLDTGSVHLLEREHVEVAQRLARPQRFEGQVHPDACSMLKLTTRRGVGPPARRDPGLIPVEGAFRIEVVDGPGAAKPAARSAAAIAARRSELPARSTRNMPWWT